MRDEGVSFDISTSRYFGISKVQPLDLLLITILNLAHVLRRHHRAENHAIGLSQLLHERIGVVRRAVTYLEPISLVYLLQLDAQFPTGDWFAEIYERY